MSKSGDAGGKMPTNDLAIKHDQKHDTSKQKDFDYSKDIVTTSLYCDCKDCLKYYNAEEPVKCIDPFLMDMNHTYWIYHGLVMASKTERAISKVLDSIEDKPEDSEENATGTTD